MEFDYLSKLNPPQRKAVEHFSGPILVLAGAGSGKTPVLTYRIAHLVLNHGVDPANILAVTFTNKATGEMRERLKAMLGEHAERLWVSTFHAAGLRILRRHAQLLEYPNNFAVYDDDDSKQLLRRVMKELNIDEKRHPPEPFRSAIDRAKNDGINAEKYAARASNPFSRLCAEVYLRYQQTLFAAGAMDFGDLLLNTVALFEKERELLQLYRHNLHFILVDEFQDTNLVQYRLIRLLSEPRRNLLVVGDDDQSIYAFRGADIANILEFEKDYPDTKVVTLEQNYRSTATILDIAHAVIKKNSSRKPKKLWTAESAGVKAVLYAGYNETEEAAFIAGEIDRLKTSGMPLSGFAVFYRTNAQSRAIEEALLRKRIPYRIFGGLKFYERKEIKDILAYLKLIANEKDSQAFVRALNTPPRGIGGQTLQRIIETAQERRTSLWEAAVEMKDSNSKIKAFVELISQFRELSAERHLGELISAIISETSYEHKLKQSKDAESGSRIENLRELIAIGESMAGAGAPRDVLQAFLDRVTLTTSDELSLNEQQRVQTLDGEKPQAVSLMTLHLAKGLEFPVVFLTGMEEGLLPHYRALQDLSELGEERRLCYVGITRARKQLYLTRAAQRGMFSSGGGFGTGGRYRKLSRFLEDIPPELLDDRSPDMFQERDWDSDEFSQPEPEISWWQRKRLQSMEAVRANRAKPAPVISTADEIETLPEGAILLRDQPYRILPGLRVLHPHFGLGVISSVDGNAAADPQHTKVKVLFDKEPKAKTLLLGKAILALAE